MNLLELPLELLEIIYSKSNIKKIIKENYGYKTLAYSYEYSLLANLCKQLFEKKLKIKLTPIQHKQYVENFL